VVSCATQYNDITWRERFEGSKEEVTSGPRPEKCYGTYFGKAERVVILAAAHEHGLYAIRSNIALGKGGKGGLLLQLLRWSKRGGGRCQQASHGDGGFHHHGRVSFALLVHPLRRSIVEFVTGGRGSAFKMTETCPRS
jgi:hypothetical protein